MKYQKIRSAKFISRPNRFVAKVEIDGFTETVHVKNTGRCRELLVPGATVYLEDFEGRMGTRKMRYSLVAVEKILDGEKTLLVNMDSQAPNKVAGEALADGRIRLPGMKKLTYIKPECTYGDSRIDFYVEDEEGQGAFVEVKGVTLEHDGHCTFPDAPTLRGIKHLRELEKALHDGKNAYALFIIQMEHMTDFGPSDVNHPEFGAALREVAASGVGVLAYQCHVKPDSLEVTEPLEVKLS